MTATAEGAGTGRKRGRPPSTGEAGPSPPAPRASRSSAPAAATAAPATVAGAGVVPGPQPALAEDDKSAVSSVGGRALRARKPSPVPPGALDPGMTIKKEVSVSRTARSGVCVCIRN